MKEAKQGGPREEHWGKNKTVLKQKYTLNGRDLYMLGI